MRRLACKLLILVLVMGALFFTPPQLTKADYWQFVECSEQLFADFGSCSGDHFICISNAGSDPQARAACDAAYAACLSGAQGSYYGCNPDPTPQPLPVIDDARSQCNETCYNNCSVYENLGDRAACMTPCTQYCNATYPKP